MMQAMVKPVVLSVLMNLSSLCIQVLGVDLKVINVSSIICIFCVNLFCVLSHILARDQFILLF